MVVQTELAWVALKAVPRGLLRVFLKAVQRGTLMASLKADYLARHWAGSLVRLLALTKKDCGRAVQMADSRAVSSAEMKASSMAERLAWHWAGHSAGH